MLEYARNVLGIEQATHAEYDPSAADVSRALITLASCPIDDVDTGTPGPRLEGKLRVTLLADSLAYRIYGRAVMEESFHCSYGLNPEFQPLFDGAELRIVGTGEAGEARIVELAGAPFFIGTLFLPQMRPAAEGPHPLIVAYLAHVLR